MCQKSGTMNFKVLIVNSKKINIDLQHATPTTKQGQQAILTTNIMQQQCHLTRTTIQGQGKGNKQINTSK
jgi:hypothetical protein